MSSLAIVGLGTMGLPIAQAVINNKLIANNNLVLVGRNIKRLAKFSKHNPRIKLHTSLSAIAGCDYVLLAVRPQDFMEFAKELATQLTPQTIILSVMAGVSTKKIQQALGVKQVIRLMPNLGLLVGQGVIGCYFAPSTKAPIRKFVKKIFSALGILVTAKSEDQLNHLTAISGSGPAYVALLMQAMEVVSKSAGFHAKVSKELVAQTLIGTIAYLEREQLSPAELIESMTSINGTTTAAFKQLNQKKVAESLEQAMQAAYLRSLELAK